VIDKIRNIIAFSPWRIKTKIMTFFCFIVGNMILKWWNVKCSGKINFSGLPEIIKHHTGKIIIGKNCTIRSASWSNTAGINRKTLIRASRDATIKIGDNCGISAGVLAASESIIIGNRVLFGVNCTLLDSDRHHIVAENRFAGVKPRIVIEDGVIVLKGVTIGVQTVVAANSVVTTSLPSNVIAGGTPAKNHQKVMRSDLVIYDRKYG
jgi:acetyltransferase-like isoleucine patch superfamily enzyme